MAQLFTIRRDGARDIRFTGSCLATVRNSFERARSDWSGQVGRWQALALYRTAKGKYVCERISYTQWQGEHTGYAAAVCDDVPAVFDFFGCGRLAKELYAEADIDTVEEVE